MGGGAAETCSSLAKALALDRHDFLSTSDTFFEAIESNRPVTEDFRARCPGFGRETMFASSAVQEAKQPGTLLGADSKFAHLTLDLSEAPTDFFETSFSFGVLRTSLPSVAHGRHVN